MKKFLRIISLTLMLAMLLPMTPVELFAAESAPQQNVEEVIQNTDGTKTYTISEYKTPIIDGAIGADEYSLLADLNPVAYCDATRFHYAKPIEGCGYEDYLSSNIDVSIAHNSDKIYIAIYDLVSDNLINETNSQNYTKYALRLGFDDENPDRFLGLYIQQTKNATESGNGIIADGFTAGGWASYYGVSNALGGGCYYWNSNSTSASGSDTIPRLKWDGTEEGRASFPITDLKIYKEAVEEGATYDSENYWWTGQHLVRIEIEIDKSNVLDLINEANGTSLSEIDTLLFSVQQSEMKTNNAQFVWGGSFDADVPTSAGSTLAMEHYNYDKVVFVTPTEDDDFGNDNENNYPDDWTPEEEESVFEEFATSTHDTSLTQLGQNIYSTGANYKATSSISIDGKINADEGWVLVTPNGPDKYQASSYMNGASNKGWWSANNGSVNIAPSTDYDAVWDLAPDFKYYVAQSEDKIYIAFEEDVPYLSTPVGEKNFVTLNNSRGYYFRLGFNVNDYRQQVVLSSDSAAPSVSGFAKNGTLDTTTDRSGIMTSTKATSSYSGTAAWTKRTEIELDKAAIIAAYKAAYDVTLTKADLDTMFIMVSLNCTAYADSGAGDWTDNILRVLYGTLLSSSAASAAGENTAIPDVIVFGEEKSGTAFTDCSFTGHSLEDRYLVEGTTDTYYHACTHCGMAGASTFKVANDALVYDKEIVSEDTVITAATCTTAGTYNKSCSCGRVSTSSSDIFEYTEPHDFTAKVVADKYEIKAPTCIAGGIYNVSCKVCGEKGTDTFTVDSTLWPEGAVKPVYHGQNTYYAENVLIDNASIPMSTDFSALEDAWQKVTPTPIVAQTHSGGAFTQGLNKNATIVNEDKLVITPEMDYYVAKSEDTVYLAFNMLYKNYTELLNGSKTVVTWRPEYYRIGFNNSDYTQQIMVSFEGHGMHNGSHKIYVRYTTEDSATLVYNGLVKDFAAFEDSFFDYRVGGDSSATGGNRARRFAFDIEKTKAFWLKYFGEELTDEDFNSMYVASSCYFSADTKVNDAYVDWYGLYGTLLLDGNSEEVGLTTLIPDLIVFGSEKTFCNYTEHVADARYLVAGTTDTYYHSCALCGDAGTKTFKMVDGSYYTEKNTELEGALVTAPTCSKNGVYKYSCSCGEIGEATFEGGVKPPHQMVQVISDRYFVKAATCIAGAIYYKSCSACGEAGTATFTTDPLRWKTGAATIDQTDLGAYGQSVYTTGEENYLIGNDQITLDGVIDDAYVCVTPDGVTFSDIASKEFRYSSSSSYRFTKLVDDSSTEADERARAELFASTLYYYVAQDDNYVYLLIENYAPDNQTGSTFDKTLHVNNTHYNIKFGFDPNNYDNAIWLRAVGGRPGGTPNGLAVITDSKSKDIKTTYPNLVTVFDNKYLLNGQEISPDHASGNIACKTNLWVDHFEVKIKKSDILSIYADEAYFEDQKTADINFNTMFLSITAKQLTEATEGSFYPVYGGNYYNYDAVPEGSGLPDRYVPDVIVFGEEKNLGCNFTAHSTDAAHLVAGTTDTYYHSCVDCGSNGIRTFKMVDGSYYTEKNTELESATVVAATCEGKGTYKYSCSCGAIGEATFEVDALGHTGATTFESDAEGHWSVCSVCDTEGTALPAGGIKVTHAYTVEEGENVYDAGNCTTAPKFYKLCECGKVATEAGDDNINIFEGSIPGHTGANERFIVDAEGHWTVCDACYIDETTVPAGNSKVAHDISAENKELPDAVISAETCTEQGVYHLSCECGYIDEADETTKIFNIDAIGHKFDDKTTKTFKKNDVSCTVNEAYYVECAACHVTSKGTEFEESFEIEGSKDAHIAANQKTEPAKAPTCIAVGWNEYKHCACGYSTYEDNKLAPTRFAEGTEKPVTIGGRIFYTGESFKVNDSQINMNLSSAPTGTRWQPLEDVWVNVTPDGLRPTICNTRYYGATNVSGVQIYSNHTYEPITPTYTYNALKSDKYVYLAFDEIWQISAEGINGATNVRNYDQENIRIGFNPDDYTQMMVIRGASNGLSASGQGIEIFMATRDGVSEAVYTGYNADCPYFEYVVGGNGSGVSENRIKKYAFDIEAIKELWYDTYGVVLTDEDFNSVYVAVSNYFHANSGNADWNATYGTVLPDGDKLGLTTLVPDMIVFGAEQLGANGFEADACNYTAHDTADAYLVAELSNGDKLYVHSCTECGAASSTMFKLTADGERIYDYKGTDIVDSVITAVTCESDGEYYYTCSCGEVDPEKNIYTVEALGHKFYDKQTKTFKKNDASCTVDETYYTQCAVCHVSSEGTDDEATFVIAGTKDAHIAANQKTMAAKAPTCIAVGWNEYQYCDACGYSTYAANKIAPTRWPEGAANPAYFGQNIFFLEGKDYTVTNDEMGTYSDSRRWEAINASLVKANNSPIKPVVITGQTDGVSKNTVDLNPDKAMYAAISPDYNYYVARSEDKVYVSFEELYNYNANGVNGQHNVLQWSAMVYRIGFNPEDPMQQLVVVFGGHALPTQTFTVKIADASKVTTLYDKNSGTVADFTLFDYFVGGPASGSIDKVGATRIRNFAFDKDIIKQLWKDNFDVELSDSAFDTLYVEVSNFYYGDVKVSGDYVTWTASYGAVVPSATASKYGVAGLIPETIVFGDRAPEDDRCEYTHVVDDKYLVSTAADGTKTYYHSCVECGAIGGTVFKIDPTNNLPLYDANSIDAKYLAEGSSAATCTTAGIYNKNCVCGAMAKDDEAYMAVEGNTATFEVDPLGHDEIPHAAQAATCTSGGWNAYVTCSRCDYSTYSPIGSLGHGWSAWTVDPAPTAEAIGTATRTCETSGACGIAETVELPTLTEENVTETATVGKYTYDGTKYTFYFDDETTVEILAKYVSVNISWGTMSFVYSNRKWNPDTMSYDLGEWEPAEEGANVITVENVGTIDVNVTFVYVSLEAFENVISGSFDGVDENDSVMVVANETKNVQLELTRLVIPEVGESIPVGSITITINAAEDAQ